jgi:flagellar motor switch protein FliN/FliY
MDPMTTRTLPRTDIESIVAIAADSIAELAGSPATTTSTHSMAAPQVSMATVIDGNTVVFGISIDRASVVALAATLLPDLQNEPDEAEIEGVRLTITTQVLAAIEEAVGQPLVEVDPEPFDSTFRVELGDSAIEIGVISIPTGEPATAPVTGNRLSSVRLDVSVELGRAKIPVKELLALDEGGVIRLGRPVGEPVDLVVNGTVTARGEIVVVDGRLGLRVTSLV